jgi:hypothetical protein
MKRCPNCGTIVTGDSNRCGVCGAVLFLAQEEPLEEAVKEQQREETAAESKLMKKEWSKTQRLVIGKSIVWAASAILVFLGLFVVIIHPDWIPRPSPGTGLSCYSARTCAGSVLHSLSAFGVSILIAVLAIGTIALFIWIASNSGERYEAK